MAISIQHINLYKKRALTFRISVLLAVLIRSGKANMRFAVCCASILMENLDASSPLDPSRTKSLIERHRVSSSLSRKTCLVSESSKCQAPFTGSFLPVLVTRLGWSSLTTMAFWLCAWIIFQIILYTE